MCTNQAAALARKPDDDLSENPSVIEPSGQSCSLQPRTVMWEFKCHRCDREFETSVPRGPKEEREINCPLCASKDVVRINLGKLQEIACGG